MTNIDMTTRASATIAGAAKRSPGRRFVAGLLAGALAVSSVQAAGPGDVQWCLAGDADSTIYQQPMRDYCPWVLAGSAVGVWYGNEQAQWVLTLDQQGWSRRAASLACSAKPADLASAVGLIAACQCHNQAAADWALANPDAVLQQLRAYAGC